MPEEDQSLIQKKISLANNENSSVIIELMKDCMEQKPLVGKTEFETLVNSITLDVQGTMLKNMTDYLEDIRNGKLYEVNK
jgi:hypothetical protein